MAGKIEEDYARNSVDQAKECLREGNYTKALSLLGRAERLRSNFNGLSELVAITEVCHAATWRCSCRLQSMKRLTPDWYRVLKVNEAADSITIKKRYRQLALLLHPDKNKNIKAEEAFKLVSEAYACLSDRNLRKVFNIERGKTHCARCYALDSLPRHGKKSERESSTQSQQFQSDHWKSEQERLQEFRERARARVTSLTQDIRTRRSRWNADLETAREKYQNKRIDRKTIFSEDILERPIRESDVFKPSGRKFHVPPESDLMSILRGRRTLHREKNEVSQSLDGLLSRLKRNNGASKGAGGRYGDESDSFRGRRNSNLYREEQVLETPENAKPVEFHEKSFAMESGFSDGRFSHLRREFCTEGQARSSIDHVESCDITNRFFSKRVSPATDSFPARKLFKEDDGDERSFSVSSESFSTQLKNEADLRRQSFPVFDNKIWKNVEETSSATNSAAHVKEPHTSGAGGVSGVSGSEAEQGVGSSPIQSELHGTPPLAPPLYRSECSAGSKGQGLRGNVVGDEYNRVHKEDAWETSCCSFKKTILKEQRQKSEELLRTLERLREEAKCVAATLDKLKQSVDSSTEDLLLSKARSPLVAPT